MLPSTITTNTTSSTNNFLAMESSHTYPVPTGVHTITCLKLDLRPDSEIDHAILHPPPITTQKNIFFFWHTGYTTMHAYTQRNIRAWYRRFSKSGWSVHVIDKQPGSPLNIANYLDINDREWFPEAFANDTLGGTYGTQHKSDLVRWPLLLNYGGVYADVGFLQIGDLDALWEKTIGDAASPYDVLSYVNGSVDTYGLTNYFMACNKNNPLFLRSHKLLLKLWEGRTDTVGLHAHPLLKGVGMMGGSFSIDGTFSKEESAKMLTDYIIQGQALSAAMGLIDEEDGWNGPKYVAEHVYAIEFMVGAQLINDLTAWDGQKAFDLMSLSLPSDGEEESAEQKEARSIVETILRKSFGFKLAHGMILRVHKETLGSLWRKHVGSDVVPGTYAAWLRYGMVYWCQDELPERQAFDDISPYKTGPLLRD